MEVPMVVIPDIGLLIRTVMYYHASLICRPTDTILKCDCWNESHEGEEPSKLLGTIARVEISYPRCLKAQQNGASNVVCGNILTLPFKSGSFDVVLDLSTIDHVFGIEQILFEYYKVLKSGGKLLVSSWVSDKEAKMVTSIGQLQWIHPYQAMKGLITTLFQHVSDIILIDEVASKSMWSSRGVTIEGDYVDIPLQMAPPTMHIFVGSKP